MEQWIVFAAIGAIIGTIFVPVVAGYAVQKATHTTDDVEVETVGDAMAKAQGKRMDLRERQESDEGDGT